MTVITSHRTSTPPSSTGLSRRSALRGLGGVTVAALLGECICKPDRVVAQAATPSATETLCSEWARCLERRHGARGCSLRRQRRRRRFRDR